MQSIRSRLSRSFVRRVGRKSPMNKRRTALCTWQARTGISSALRVLHVDGKCRSNETMSCWWAHSPCVVGAHSTARRVGSPSRMKSCYVTRIRIIQGASDARCAKTLSTRRHFRLSTGGSVACIASSIQRRHLWRKSRRLRSRRPVVPRMPRQNPAARLRQW